MKTRIALICSAWLLSLSHAIPTNAQMLHHGASGLPHGVPDYCANPTVRAARSGDWGEPSTWSTSRLPATGDIVSIEGGKEVTFGQNMTEVPAAVCVEGSLRWRTDRSSTFRVGTLLVKQGGRMEVGRPGAEVPANVNVAIIFDGTLDLQKDPEQFGVGLLAFGTLTMHGATKSPTFVRTSAEPKAGASSITLAAGAGGWQAGDSLIIPDTRQLRYTDLDWSMNAQRQWEVLTVASVADNVVSLSKPLAFDHLGGRKMTGELEYLPHVGNLSRNITLSSANPTGTRAHTLASGRAEIDIRYVAFREMGRTKTEIPLHNTEFDGNSVTQVGTNQIGRYPIHMHHLAGPEGRSDGYQYTLVGNAIVNTPKWALTLHNSHYGLIADNVIYNSNGSGVMTEDGSESYNVIERNFVVRSWGTGGRQGAGREGTGFWFRGTNNVVRDNVAADIMSDGFDAAYGYKFFLERLGLVRIPKFRGADTTKDSEVTVASGHAVPIRQFERNEVYGATESGLTYWWVGTDFHTPQATEWSVIRDFVAWNVHNRGIFHYQAHRVMVDGMIMRSSAPGETSACCQRGVDFEDYFGSEMVFRRLDFEGRIYSLSGSPNTNGTTMFIDDSRLTGQVGLLILNPWTVSSHAAGLTPRRIVFRNTLFQSGQLNRLVAEVGPIIRGLMGPEKASALTLRDEVISLDHNKVRGNNVEFFYAQQVPTFVVPKTVNNPDGSPKIIGAPVDGLTNQQLMTAYGVAFAGKIAPCTAPSVPGNLVCPIDGASVEIPYTLPPTALRTSP